MPINSFLYPGPSNSDPYQVANSCRFNNGDAACMHKTPSSSGNRRTFTFSTWVKKCKAGGYQDLYSAYVDANNISRLLFWNGDEIVVSNKVGGSFPTFLRTNANFRDPSAWYHVCIAVDTTDATEANRVKIYVNGTQETSLAQSDYPSQNEDFFLNHTNEHNIGQQGDDDSALYFGGYLAETVMIDGLQLAPTSFGEFDADSPRIWRPKNLNPISGLKGTNGFYLDFEDSANLGNDVWGGTDLTEVNLAATDQASDSPTNNFATWNSLENYYQSNTYSEGNCQVQTQSTSFTYNFATIGVSAGKWYWEVEYDALSGGNDQPSIGITSTPPTANDHELGNFANDWGWYTDNNTGYQANNNSYSDIDLNDYTVGDIIGVALDLTNNKLYFRKNGTWEKSGDPTSGSTGTGAISITAPGSTPLGAYFPSVADGTNSQNATFKANFGGCSAFTVSSGNSDANGYGNFEYSVPSGYYSLCTKNLAEFGG